ncbi:MAG: IclR family transcriptional regulator [Anaerolineae bacterium]|uniref:IclR family transcriptional regulator n=1 Tax=Promineifilum sp. TaxID=2664178 RepID=UPI001DA17EF9|nr:IclR family transcriptional regulator [Anaerolineales bacterium]MCO5179028.1 IclR family transcriptional regulator [Promineifilum sp.]MCW5846264.1 IclR family transcriptional regulator [Anaerolineae bacterium]
MTDNTYPGTQAVQRAMALLKAFNDEHPAWGLSALARETGLNKTTAHRLLSALEREGMLGRAADGDRYVLGPEVVVLGGRALRANNLRAVARPELEQLAEETRETASLEILSGGEMLVIDEIVGGHLMSGVPDLGSRWPLHASSTGLAVLAYLPDEMAAGLLPRTLTPVTTATITGRVALRAELACIRERGYSVADETLEVGLVAIAAPIFDHDGRVVAALSIAGPKLRVTVDRISVIGDYVRRAAADISALLGYKP